MKKYIVLLLCSFCLLYSQDKNPTRIILNLTEKPSSEIAVTWRTKATSNNPVIQYAEDNIWIDPIKSSTKTLNAKTEMITDSINISYHHSGIIKNLKPDTRYVYRIGSDSVWSEWNQFTTAGNRPSPFEFVFFADPQNGFRDFLPRVFRRALLTSPEAKFWLFTGDITDNPKLDKQWSDLFFSLGFISEIIPSVMVPGNHEYAAISKNRPETRGLTKFWRAHFTLPENGADSLKELSYYFDFQGVRFIMLNGNEKLPEQAKWMDKILANNPNKWVIAAIHQPAFSMGAERDEKRTRDNFMPLFDKYSVDLVLTGHDHVYSRSFKLRNGEIVKDNEKGTVYAVSVSGTKQYKLTLKYKDLMAKYSENIQLFQVISINDNKLIYKSYEADGKLYDSFELNK